jgi:hypothetical protein
MSVHEAPQIASTGIATEHANIKNARNAVVADRCMTTDASLRAKEHRCLPRGNAG